MDDEVARYVEDVALFWENHGMPRIAGRILGLLLVCDPPYRSAGELAEELGVSKGSVSSMTRLLLASESLGTVAFPGDRATYFRLTPDSLDRKLERRLTMMIGFQALADRGVALLEGEPAERSARVRRVASLYAFLGREVPLLLERWREERDRDV